MQVFIEKKALKSSQVINGCLQIAALVKHFVSVWRSIELQAMGICRGGPIWQLQIKDNRLRNNQT